MKDQKTSLDLVVNYEKETGSFAIIDFEKQKQAFVDFVGGLKVVPIKDDFERKKYTGNRATLNKLRDKIKTQRIVTTKLIEKQFKEIEKLLDNKSKEYDKAVKDYDKQQEEKLNTAVVENTEVVVGKEDTHKLVLNGSKTALEKVLDFAQSLGLEGEIE